MPSTEQMAASITLDGVSHIAVAGAAAERGNSICFCEYSKGHSQRNISEDSVEEMHCEFVGLGEAGRSWTTWILPPLLYELLLAIISDYNPR